MKIHVVEVILETKDAIINSMVVLAHTHKHTHIFSELWTVMIKFHAWEIRKRRQPALHFNEAFSYLLL